MSETYRAVTKAFERNDNKVPGQISLLSFCSYSRYISILNPEKSCSGIKILNLVREQRASLAAAH